MIFKYSYWEIIHYIIPIMQVFLFLNKKKYLLALVELVVLQWFIFYNDCSLLFVIKNHLQSGKNLITMNKPYLDILSPLYHFGLLFIALMSTKEYIKFRPMYLMLITFFIIIFKHLPLPFKFIKFFNSSKLRYIFYFLLTFIYFSNDEYNFIELNMINIILISFSILVSFLLDFNKILYEIPVLFLLNLIIILFLYFNINKKLDDKEKKETHGLELHTLPFLSTLITKKFTFLRLFV